MKIPHVITYEELLAFKPAQRDCFLCEQPTTECECQEHQQVDEDLSHIPSPF